MVAAYSRKMFQYAFNENDNIWSGMDERKIFFRNEMTYVDRNADHNSQRGFKRMFTTTEIFTLLAALSIALENEESRHSKKWKSTAGLYSFPTRPN